MGVRESSGALSYTLGDGQYTGYHVETVGASWRHPEELVPARARRSNTQPVTSQNRIPLVQNGTVDIECGSTTNNATRQKDVAFAVTTYVEEVRIAVKANSGINVDRGPERQDRGHHHRHHLGADCCARTSAPTASTSRRSIGKDHADSFLLLESGRADAFVMDGQILAGNIAKSKTPADYKIVGEVLSVEPIAIMIRKDDPAFKKAVDDSIKRHDQDGEMAKLYDKWFMQPIPPKNTKRRPAAVAKRPRPPGPTRTTSRWKTTRKK